MTAANHDGAGHCLVIPRLRRLAVILAVAVAVASCSGSDGDLESFCETATFTATFDDAFSLDPVDFDAEAAIDQFSTALAVQREIRADAPKAARDDLDLVIDYVEDLIAGLEEYVADPPPIQGDSGRRPHPEIFETLGDRARSVELAGRRLDRFVETNCVDEPV